MRNENDQFGGTKISHETLVNYKQPSKPIVSATERQRSKKSLKSYHINGGGDAS